ncbi:magnesium transporter CorA family protein [Microvirga pudoricolor]|uniref:magnesium transporter CorA family protein n=1 Tax=Microvirga pudoricolor TaxID=2778729 RepID=UPI001950E8EF|nr:magnesium transporter CorA family protein [Microvirga pudoricolor]MBM6594601.1 magnesium transporter CorA family protein [Microvirga pudoricolor]
MILIHRPAGQDAIDSESLDRHIWRLGDPIPNDALWIDMIEPSRDEEKLVEHHLGIAIPTREEMADIEPSEILYNENNARYMTARVLCSSDTETPQLIDVSFILAERALVTVRYGEPRSFSMFMSRAAKPGGCRHQPEAVLDGLIETIIDRAAEILGFVGKRIDRLSRSIFDNEKQGSRRSAAYRAALKSIGRKADLISNVRESMASVERMLLFLSSTMPRPQRPRSYSSEWRTAIRDVQSIEEHAAFLNNKVQFLLDATLGLVAMEQNDIIKIFSVMSVIFLPPTLISSIYGMNFKLMPELDWNFGYPLAIAMIVLAAVLPYLFFRWKRWL